VKVIVTVFKKLFIYLSFVEGLTTYFRFLREDRKFHVLEGSNAKRLILDAKGQRQDNAVSNDRSLL